MILFAVYPLRRPHQTPHGLEQLHGVFDSSASLIIHS